MARRWLLVLLLLAALVSVAGAAGPDDSAPPPGSLDGGCDAAGTCPAPDAMAPRAAGGPTITTVSRTETAIAFKTDRAPELDVLRGADAGTPDTITFTINCSELRDVKNTSNPVSATLAVRVFDVDANGDADTPECLVELDLVRFNGHDLGRLTGANEMWSINSFRVDPAWVVEGENTVVIVINALHTPCWTMMADWGEVRVELQPLPRIERIAVAPSVPVTGKSITFSATFHDEPSFEITGVRWYLYNGTTGKEIASSATEGRKVNPWRFTPPAGQYGNRTVVCRAVCRNTRTGVDGIPCGEKRLDFGVFFPMVEGSSNWETTEYDVPNWAKDPSNPGNATTRQPNWFVYWKRDRAVDGIEPFGWDPTGGAGWMDPDTGECALGPMGASYWPAEFITTSFGIEQLAGTVGLDTAVGTVWHEKRHYEIHHAEDPGGPFHGLADSDWFVNDLSEDDDLPDAFENGTIGTAWEPAGSLTNWSNTDTYGFATLYAPEYRGYGDNEYLAYRADNAARASGKYHDDSDWSDTGAIAKAQGAAPPVARFVPGTGSSFTPVTPGFAGGTGFTGTFSETGIDENGNGLVDLVRVTAGLAVNGSALYTVEGTLTDPAGTELAHAGAAEKLAAGTYSVDLDFDALDLQASGVGGPYHLTIELLAGGHDRFARDRGDDAFATRAYALAELEGSQVAFTGAIDDAGADTNSDGAFDTLEVAVALNAARAVNATLTGSLYAGETLVAIASAPLALSPGPASGTLRFDGLAIASAWLDGPYEVRGLAIVDSDGRPIAHWAATYTTAPYRWTQFRPAALALQHPFSETREDSEGDGKINRLVLGANANVTIPGRYTFAGVLADSTGSTITEASSTVELGSGAQAVALPFEGTAIFSHGKNGPYRLAKLLVTDAAGAVVAYETDAHTTASIAYTAFQRPGIALAVPHTDAGEDTNGNGRFETLAVPFDVTVPWQGSYKVNARLLALDGREVQWASTEFTGFGTRTATLRFDGRRIRATGQSEAFTIADLTVYWSGTSSPPFVIPPLYAPAAFETKVYQSSQFEPGAGIEGTVSAASGAPVSNATVFIIGAATSTTDADGGYALAVPSAGNYTVRVEPPAGSGLSNASANVTVAVSDVATLDFTLAAVGPSVVTIPGGAGLPADLNADRVCEDVNGNGRKDFADVVLYFNQMSWIAANEPMGAFDYNGNARIDFADVVWLFNHL